MNDLLDNYNNNIKNNGEILKEMRILKEVAIKYLKSIKNNYANNNYINDGFEFNLGHFIVIFFIKEYSIENKFLTLEDIIENPDIIASKIRKIIKDFNHYIKVKNLTKDKLATGLLYGGFEERFNVLLSERGEVEKHLHPLPLPFLNCYFNKYDFDFTKEELNLHKSFIKFFAPDKEYLTDDSIYKALSMDKIYRMYFYYSKKNFDQTPENEQHIYTFSKGLDKFFGSNIPLLDKYQKVFPQLENFTDLVIFASLKSESIGVDGGFNFDNFLNNYSKAMPLEWNLELLL